MKLVKILSVFAVFAAAGMTAGCESPAGTGNGNESAPALTEAGSDTAAGKEIKIEFEVLNGGMGLWSSTGIVSTQDDRHLAHNWDLFSGDYPVTITVPSDDEYLNIRWEGWQGQVKGTYVKAKIKPESGTITLDYNGHGKVAVKNLYDVRVSGDYGSDLYDDWADAYRRAVRE